MNRELKKAFRIIEQGKPLAGYSNTTIRMILHLYSKHLKSKTLA